MIRSLALVVVAACAVALAASCTDAAECAVAEPGRAELGVGDLSVGFVEMQDQAEIPIVAANFQPAVGERPAWPTFPFIFKFQSQTSLMSAALGLSTNRKLGTPCLTTFVQACTAALVSVCADEESKGATVKGSRSTLSGILRSLHLVTCNCGSPPKKVTRRTSPR